MQIQLSQPHPTRKNDCGNQRGSIGVWIDRLRKSELRHDSQRQSPPKSHVVLLSASPETGSLCVLPTYGALLLAMRRKDMAASMCVSPPGSGSHLHHGPFCRLMPTTEGSNPHSPALHVAHGEASRGFLPQGLTNTCPLRKMINRELASMGRCRTNLNAFGHERPFPGWVFQLSECFIRRVRRTGATSQNRS